MPNFSLRSWEQVALKPVLVVVIVISEDKVGRESVFSGSYGRVGSVRMLPRRMAVFGGQSKSGLMKYFFGCAMIRILRCG